MQHTRLTQEQVKEIHNAVCRISNDKPKIYQYIVSVNVTPYFCYAFWKRRDAVRVCDLLDDMEIPNKLNRVEIDYTEL